MKLALPSRLIMALIRAAWAIVAPRSLIAGLLAALTVLIESAPAAPGDVDAVFNPKVSGVLATAVQPDGKILLAGDFTSVAGGAHQYLARLNGDGTLDSAFNPNLSGAASSGVYAVAVQADGKIVIGGSFTTVSGTARAHLARLQVNGALDTGFAPGLSDDVTSLAIQNDGRILIGGTYHLKRLNTNGTLDGTFNNAIHGTGFYFINAIATQPDGKIVIGSFARGIVRLLANGSTDAAFNPNANSSAYELAVQPDGKILAAGAFTTIGGTARNGFARLNANGTLDTAFNPAQDGSVLDMALQADGRILVGGSFTAIGGTPRSNTARLNANGTLDGTFMPNVNGPVSRLSMQADGKIIIGGEFSEIGGVSRSGIARLDNDPAIGALAITGANRVEWLRGGALPEVEQVAFELSTDGGNIYSPLGTGTRIAGGWEKSGLSLPASGEVRARGRTTGGRGSGVVEKLAAFGSASPEIAVEQPQGTNVADGGSFSFGTLDLGDGGSIRTFTIRNTGTASLTGLEITTDGLDYAMFSVITSPNQPVPGGGSTTFTVQFMPTTTGAKSAALHIASNDSDENPYDLVLTGTAALSTNARLAALSLNSATLAPHFASATTSYTSTVNSRTGSLTVTPVTSGSAATVRVNGVAVASGSTSAPIGLSAGANLISTVVTAGDGTTTKTYTVTVTHPGPGPGPGDVDLGFDPNVNGTVSATAIQPDGKIVIGGDFTVVAGAPRNRLARFHADGVLDTAFNPGTNDTVNAAVIQTDGKIVIGGRFTSVNGTARNYLARLRPDGTLDSAFNPNPNGLVQGLAIQGDGKILFGGLFFSVGPTARTYLARLNSNGTLDTLFNPNVGGWVNSVTEQPDGKIVIGGSFFTIEGVTRNYIARLNANGTLDSAFNPNANNTVFCVATQPDGKVLLGGFFTTIGGVARNGFARVNVDGTLDTGFNPDGRNAFSVAVQADGRVLYGGGSLIEGTGQSGVARLESNGEVDSSFYRDPGGHTSPMAVQADGSLFAGGALNTPGGAARGGFVRLLNGPASQSLSVPGANRVEWLRAGASPEIGQVTFELSADGGNSYSLLGSGTRMSGGWEITGLSLPNSGIIRARGRASSSIIESVVPWSSSALEMWRFTHFGTFAAAGDATDNADPDKDGADNRLEYAFSLNPTLPDAAALPSWQYSGGECVVSFTRGANVSGLTYIAEQSSTMAPGSWSAIPNSATPPLFTFHVAPSDGNRRYLRLRVTVP